MPKRVLKLEAQKILAVPNLEAQKRHPVSKLEAQKGTLFSGTSPVPPPPPPRGAGPMLTHRPQR